jgi:hypothetical protein
MHMEALNTIGLSQEELQQRRQLDKRQKHKLGIPPSEYFERNRDENASNLMKIVAQSKEKRKNMVRSQVNFRMIQVLPSATPLPAAPAAPLRSPDSSAIATE